MCILLSNTLFQISTKRQSVALLIGTQSTILKIVFNEISRITSHILISAEVKPFPPSYYTVLNTPMDLNSKQKIKRLESKH